jgi:hypothetical protein
VSREGLFLHTEAAESMGRTILSLRFCVDGVERCLRGTAVHGVPGEGVGIQLAVWRPSERADHYAYRQLIDTHTQVPHRPTPDPGPGRSRCPQYAGSGA